jgi:membrane protease YdiL (CAAX protease family)
MLPWAQAFAGTSGQGSIKQWRRMSSAEQADGQGRPAPWGYWATAGWVGVALLCSLIASLAVLTVWQPEALAGSGELLKNGPLISLTGIISAVVEITVLALAARLAGWPEADYLGLVPPSRRALLTAFGYLIPFLLGYDALTWLIGKDIVSPFQLDTYRSAKEQGDLILLWLAFVIAAPLSEEIIFRGFLFRGWIRSPRAAWPGILAISAFFAALHVQYDVFGIVQVFFIGVVLGWTRWWSGSTLLTVLMHATINLWATLQSVVKVEWLS